ncbi:MAG: thioredoxin domain-containing protein [Bdellovibrionales bacterium]|nr:thioredoxin domain-containing protein [Bdellovibrionales bacterium]
MKRSNSFFRGAVLTAGVAALGIAIAPLTANAIPQEEFNKAMDNYLKSNDGAKALGSTIENYFKNRQAEARKEREMAAQKEMEEQFSNPKDIPVGTSPVKGPKDATVTIIEFSDFECPYCSRANETMEQVMKEYKGKVRVAFKNLPLPFHKNAKPAAAAALAAGEQGKFWEMHDKLFENQRELSDDFFKKTAEELGLDVKKFLADMTSEKVNKQIEEDMKLARENGISGTPGFFVNGVAVKGAQPFPVFKDVIDRWLNKGGKA